MPKMKNVLAFLRDPAARLTILSSRGWLNWMGDEAYVKRAYRIRMGKALCLEEPRAFSEKLQWLKLHDRNPLYSRLVDKYEVRQYIAQQLGEDCLIPLVGGPWASFDEIDFDALPDQFVLKCTHDSGGLVICRDKAKMNMEAAREKLERCLKRNYYWSGREWPYKNVRRRIIAERYMEEDGSDTLTDYKVFCFGGVPKVILTVVGGHGDESRTLRRMYDTDWNLLPIALHGKPFVDEKQPKPDKLGEILALAEKLSAGKPHVRTDFYVIGGRVYFGEITFYHMSGMARIEPEEWNLRLGSWIRLPERAE